MLSHQVMRGLFLHIALYLFAVVAAFQFSESKRLAAAYNVIDYPFYLGFYSKAFDGSRQASHNINPEGLGVLGFHGTEGATSFHQAIHLEPIKYAIAALYRLAPDARVLQMVFIMFFFIPVLYLWYALGVNEPDRAWFLSAIYVFFPSALQEATFDLRPFSMLAPCFLMLMVSIQRRRPAVEQILFFALLFCIREEGLVLGAVAIAYSASIHCRHALSFRAVWVIPLLLWLVCFVITFLYYYWTGYQWTVYLYRIKFIESNYRIMLPLIAAAGLVLVASFLYCWCQRPRFRPAVTIAIYSAVVAMLATQMALFIMKGDDPGGWTASFMKRLCGDRTHLFLSTTLPLVFVIQDARPSPGAGPRRRAAGWLLIAICMVVSVWPASWSPRAAYSSYRLAASSIAPLWDLRRNTDPSIDVVLVDYEALQVFADYEHVYSYRRLPVYMAGGKTRYYPLNWERLIELIRGDVDYFASASARGKQDLAALIKQSGIASRSIEDNGTAWIQQSVRFAGSPP